MGEAGSILPNGVRGYFILKKYDMVQMNSLRMVTLACERHALRAGRDSQSIVFAGACCGKINYLTQSGRVVFCVCRRRQTAGWELRG